MKRSNWKSKFLAVALLADFCSLAGAASAQRLPQTASPESYDLKFTPDLAKATFAGEETIEVVLHSPSDRITLNSAEIKINSATISGGGNSQTATVSYDTEKEQATLAVPKTIAAGPATIHMAFDGILNNELR